MVQFARMSIKIKVGQRIREIRKELGISQEALANKAEIDRTYITDVENGRRNISIENLERILAALNVEFKGFFDSPIFK
jgi:transcriptional regulator with XRE-family HTH domain